MLINVASYHLAYVVALAGALVIVGWHQQTNALVVTTAVLFLLFSLGLSAAVLGLSGRHHERLAHTLRTFPAVRTALDLLAGADARLVRSPRLLTATSGLQLAIVLLDASTLWALIAALGITASVTGVFASFMIASLFRTMGIVPGGLGTFEATSVLMLRMVGVDLAVALRQSGISGSAHNARAWSAPVRHCSHGSSSCSRDGRVLSACRRSNASGPRTPREAQSGPSSEFENRAVWNADPARDDRSRADSSA